jgi:hypothetical protein
MSDNRAAGNYPVSFYKGWRVLDCDWMDVTPTTMPAAVSGG